MAEYIKRDDVIEAIASGDPTNGWENIFCGRALIGMITQIPAADVRPVVRGKWVQTGGKYSRNKTIDRRILTCSVCGNFLHMEGVNAGRGDANFCPNCGADMREES